MDSSIVVWTFWTAVRQSIAVCVSFSSMYQEIRQQHQQVSLSVHQPTSQFAQTNTLMSSQCIFSSLCTVSWTVPWSYQLCVNQHGVLFVCLLARCIICNILAHFNPSRTFVRWSCQLSSSRLMWTATYPAQDWCGADGNVSSSRLLRTATFPATR